MEKPTNPLESPTVDLAREAEFERQLRELVLDAVSDAPCEVFLFGSRARGETRRSSDFDIGILGLPTEGFRRVKRIVEERIEDGNIPHDIDIVDFSSASEPFRSVALRDRIVWKKD